MSATPSSPRGKPDPATNLAEVRYSLPDLLREVQEERNAPVFASEKLDQVEIAKMFQKNRPRHGHRTGK